ncbi:TetR/AcrR family transcriptional regulator [Dyadobacter subterraneus]|uniref:TetR/AcrR family transcriptional regulator n=1 Tax=Dyadobacter subterraneus TaxID=2773304 RepID=A0ABR9WE17_9BACT|nr:TetR/AcrR family transcriptional regulator [Dyadobacter subterraneus]MBE9463736.1 TetR/AcrR family transcriptional regulator [Dyadobacter subterraneus]
MIVKQQSIKNNIVAKSLNLFTAYGIKAVRTEDIALQSGISKRTLYAYYKSKEHLVQDVILFQIDLVKSQSDRIRIEHPSTIEEFVALWNCVSGVIHVSNPNFSRDLSRQYPQAWIVLTDFESEFRTDFLVGNLRKGIAQKVYRQDIDVEIISLLWLKVMGLNFKETKSWSEIRTHFLRGLLTEKGRRDYQSSAL